MTAAARRAREVALMSKFHEDCHRLFRRHGGVELPDHACRVTSEFMQKQRGAEWHAIYDALQLLPYNNCPIEVVRAAVDMGGSYQRLTLMVEVVADLLPRHLWLRLLGEMWTGFDNVGRHLHELAEQLPCGTEPEMMTKAERAALAALPEVVTIFRGCGSVNRDGICWTLDRDVAAGFPALNRNRVPDPVLLTATVRRDEIVALKLDREEQEVITFDAEIVAEESLLPERLTA